MDRGGTLLAGQGPIPAETAARARVTETGGLHGRSFENGFESFLGVQRAVFRCLASDQAFSLGRSAGFGWRSAGAEAVNW